MPNTLVHFAAQGAASRGVWRRLDPRWIYLGCLLPDLPWILRRAVAGLGLPADPIDLRLYAMGQASLAGTLLLCGAVAAVALTPRLAFGVLAVNAVFHLLLDASEVKWGNGVHLFAPFSWRMSSFDLVDGEGTLFLALSVAGALLVAWETVFRRRQPVLGLHLQPKRLAAAAGLLAAYLLAPLPFLAAIESSDSYSVKTLRQVERRPGRSISLDRAAFVSTSAGGLVELWTGERVQAAGAVPDRSSRVSLRGTFVAPDVLRIDRYVEHGHSRDWPTYLALGLLGLLWIHPCARRPAAPGAV